MHLGHVNGLENAAVPGTRKARPRGRSAIIFAVLLVALVCTALTWAFVLRQIKFEREEAVRSAMAQNDDRSLMLQQYVSRTLDSADLACVHATRLLALGVIPTSTSRPVIIKDRITLGREFIGLSLVDATGKMTATTIENGEGTHNVALNPAFAVHESRDTGGLFVGRPAYSRLLGRQTILLSRRLNHADGSFAGVVAVNVAPAQLTAVFGETAVKPTESAWVVGLDGIIRSRMTGGHVTAGEDVSGGELFRKQLRVEQGRFIGHGTLDHRMRLVSHRRVPGYPLFVSYSSLQDEVLSAPRQRAQLFLIGAFLATIATAIMTFLVIYALRFRERRAAEFAAAKARLEEAQRVAGIGDWKYSFRDQRIVWSPQLYEMFERDPGQGPLLEEFLSMLSGDSVQRHRAAMDRVVKQGLETSWDVTVRLPSGRIRFHRVSAVPTRDRHDAIVGFHGTTQDITEHRNHQVLQEELAHLSRIGAMNALAATLSHELNQPLTAASNYLSAGRYLAMQLPGDAGSPLSKVLDDSTQQILRAGEIIKRIRNLVSKGTCERTVVSIGEVIEEALGTIEVTKICHSPILTREAEEDFFVSVDSIQVQQVLLNLVRNACEVQEADTPIWIAVSAEPNERVRVSVTDEGPGFPPELLEKLGAPFASSKETGLGLGLSISRTIIDAHGGTLNAANTPEGGASVSFTLPIHSRLPRNKEPAAPLRSSIA